MSSQRDEIASRIILSLHNTIFDGRFSEGDPVPVFTSRFARLYSMVAGFSVDESLVRDALNRLAEVDLVQVLPSRTCENAFDVVATENGIRFITNLDDPRVVLPEDLRSRIRAMSLAQGGTSHDQVEANASFENACIEIEALRNLLGDFESETLINKPQVSGSTLNMILSSTDAIQMNVESKSDKSWISWDCLGVRRQFYAIVRSIRREAGKPTRSGGPKLEVRETTNDNMANAMSNLLPVFMAIGCLAIESSKTPKRYFVLPCRLHLDAIAKLRTGGR